MERYGESYRLEIEAFLGGLAQGMPAPVNAFNGLRAVYLAEAAAASLRLGKAIELKKQLRGDLGCLTTFSCGTNQRSPSSPEGRKALG